MERLIVGSDNLVKVVDLYDVAAASYVTSATVEGTLYDKSGTEVTGVTWPITLSYQAGTDGEYHGVIPDAANITAGKRYSLHIEADDGADRLRLFDVGCVAVRG